MTFVSNLSDLLSRQANSNRLLARTVSNSWRFLAGLKSFASRHRRPILLIALLFFSGGLIYSASALELRMEDIHWLPLVIVALVLTPATVLYSAINMMLMARAAQVPIGLVDGIRISAYAQVAELLPIPGGAIVRGAALHGAGASAAQSTRIVIGFSLLWIACASVATGLAFWNVGPLLQFFAIGSLAVLLAIGTAITLEFGFFIAGVAFGLRVFGLGLVALRLLLVFTALGQVIDLQAASLFAFASVVGSAASLVPGGLGISESLSAILSGSVGIAATTAFLSLGLNRIIGLAVHLVVASCFAFAAGSSPFSKGPSVTDRGDFRA